MYRIGRMESARPWERPIQPLFKQNRHTQDQHDDVVTTRPDHGPHGAEAAQLSAAVVQEPLHPHPSRPLPIKKPGGYRVIVYRLCHRSCR
ncbi:MAG: hypothetical protein HQL69_23385 [Magnetococcales bacterium]|nr:hypothetical protein [Magnetococcales bacterium]